MLILTAQYMNSSLVEGIRNRSFDIYQRLDPRIPSKSSPVVVVDIDEKSLAAVGQWPWSRDVLAEIIQKLTDAGSVVVGMDIVFPEADRLSAPLLAKKMQGLDSETRKKLAMLPGNDEILAKAMKRSRVVLGGYLSNEKGVVQTNTLNLLPSINWVGKNPIRYIKSARTLVGNVDVLEKAAAGFSTFTLDSDFDGIIRRIPLLSRVGEKLIPILGLEILRVATGRNVLVRASENGVEGVVVARSLIPTDGFGRMWIRFSKYDQSQYVPAVDILNGNFNPKRFTGKLVLLGTSATGLKDLRSTPVDSVVPGVEIHAQMLQTVLSGDHLFRGDLMRAIEWGTVLLIGIALIAFVPVAGARNTFLALIALLGVDIGIAAYLFFEKSILMDATFFVAASTLLYIVLVYSSFRSTEQQRSQIRSAFSHYLSPDLVQRLTDQPDQLRLGGEVKTMTFLFCDIRGFTPISELFNDDPEGLTKLINNFLTPMTDIILKKGGTIDKYMGDCIMAFWNAPLDDPDHARHAVDAATEMHKELIAVNSKLKHSAEESGRDHIPIRVGIGINTGKCVVGNMGSDQRFDYSVLGDAVNLAARLEGQSKSYGVDTIIGPKTVEHITDIECLELDLLAVKGKSEAVRIYGLIKSELNLTDDSFQALKERNTDMLVAYRGKKWLEARKCAKTCLALEPRLSILYSQHLDRIEKYAQEDPGSDWHGVFEATTK
ncbi:MAG: adenylate/guanylate cyclase domain-containing protein [Sneathiella sp.]